MNRKKMQRQLSVYLDHELNEAEQLTVEKHLSGCQESAETFENLQQNSQLMSGLRQPTPSGIWEGVQSRIEEENKGSWKSRFTMPVRGWFLHPIPVASMVVLITVFAFSLFILDVDQNSLEDPLDFYLIAHSEQTTGFWLMGEDSSSQESSVDANFTVSDESQAYLDTYFGY
ncbi:MAG: zf-HC2 domain-containing protein [Candidatus Poribacteria bacterium]|nr:zf-HC2 domain-containing protein [Candidatus Poribacteria bacterium]